MSEKKQALTFTLGGAPATPHTVDGLPGYFQVGRLTPIGELGEPTAEQAKEASGDEGCPVKLVSATDKQVEEARAWQLEVRQLASGAIAAGARSGDGGTVARAINESASGGEE